MCDCAVKVKSHHCCASSLSLMKRQSWLKVDACCSDKSSKRARDLHLLKKLKTALKEASAETGGFDRLANWDSLFNMREGMLVRNVCMLMLLVLLMSFVFARLWSVRHILPHRYSVWETSSLWCARSPSVDPTHFVCLFVHLFLGRA